MNLTLNLCMGLCDWKFVVFVESTAAHLSVFRTNIFLLMTNKSHGYSEN